MATAANPYYVRSSPRHASTTPSNARKHRASSSPALPSPSAILRVGQTMTSMGVKSGPWTQQSTPGANAGFASAKDVLRAQESETHGCAFGLGDLFTAERSTLRNGKIETRRGSGGRLSKPKIAPLEEGRKARFAGLSPGLTCTERVETGGRELGSIEIRQAENNLIDLCETNESKSLDVATFYQASVYDFAIDEAAIPSALTSRKRIVKLPRSDSGGAKKPHKRKASDQPFGTEMHCHQVVKRKPSSTRVIDSSSSTRLTSSLTEQKLSCTQVLDSDESEQEAASFPSVETKSVRKAANSVLASWRADVRRRQQERKKCAEAQAVEGLQMEATRNKITIEKSRVRQARPIAQVTMDMPDERSRFFVFEAGRHSVREGATAATNVAVTGSVEEREDYAVNVATTAAQARRRDWTPVPDTLITTCGTNTGLDTIPRPTPNCDGEHSRDLSAILGGFVHIENNTPKPSKPHLAIADAVTKRQKVELADTSTTCPSRRGRLQHDARPSNPTRKQRQPKEKVPKERRPKAPPKKPRTITALATAAYQQTEEPPAGAAQQSTVSTFFAPTKSPTSPNVEAIPAKSEVEVAPAPTECRKPKKQRKPRVKTIDLDANGKRIIKPVKAAKPKKKAKVIAPKPCLHSPEQACEQIERQCYLFGTSSQLAVEDSPELLRQRLQILEESESSPTKVQDITQSSQVAADAESSMHASLVRSKIAVPTAPHGTSLRIGQADRDLWCVAARDTANKLLADGPDLQCENTDVVPVLRKSPTAANKVEHSSGLETLHCVAQVTDDDQLAVHAPAQSSTSAANATARQASTVRGLRASNTETTQPETIDLCHSSPSAPTSAQVAAGCEDKSSERGPVTCTTEPAKNAPAPEPICNNDEGNDAWMFLGSDDSVADDSLPRASDREQNARTAQSPFPPPLPTIVHRTPRHTSSQAPRAVLQPLDANVSLLMASLPEKRSHPQTGERAFIASAVSPATKSTATGCARGQLAQPVVAGWQTSSTPTKRKRGRSGKVESCTAVSQPLGSIRSRKKLTHKLVSPGSDSFVNIDEISDSDTPTTPSPPRRRASSSPPAVQPLPFNIPDPAYHHATVASATETSTALAVGAHLKPTDAQWLEMQKICFQNITKAVKSAPHNLSSDEPSWHEKVLVYDPIEVEALTAWLNEGSKVTITVQQLKPRAKAKSTARAKVGRKGTSKDAAEDAAQEIAGAVSTTYMEVFMQELKPWMVRKWCEAHSICCFSKDPAGSGWSARGKSY